MQTLLLRLLLHWFAESRVLVIGLFAAFTNEVLLALAPNKGFAFGAIALGTLGSVAFPAISSIKANNVAESEQVCVPLLRSLLGSRVYMAVAARPLICLTLRLHDTAERCSRNLLLQSKDTWEKGGGGGGTMLVHSYGTPSL